MRILIVLFTLMLPLIGFSQEQLKEDMTLSTPEQIATAYAEKDVLAGGVVSPFSGQVILRQKDLVIQGAQPITISRVYFAPSIPSSFRQHKKRQSEWDKFYLGQHLQASYYGWEYFPHLHIEYFFNSQVIRFRDKNGITLDFLYNHRLSKCELISPSYGLSNLLGETPSGKHDVRNTRIVVDKSGGFFSVFSPDGTVRFYGKAFARRKDRLDYCLLKEVLPNGKILLYHYNHMHSLVLIEAKDPHEQLIYAKVHVKNYRSFVSPVTFNGENGVEVRSDYFRRSLLAKLKKNPFTGTKMERFQWSPILSPMLVGVSSPFFREEVLKYDFYFLLNEYTGPHEQFRCSYAGYNNNFKVQSLLFPVGAEGAFHPVYTFDYVPAIPGQRAGHTFVKHADGSSIRYDISNEFLITGITWFDSKGAVKKRETRHFSSKHYLKAIEIHDENNHCLYHKSFESDSFGNPIKETFHGNLTGSGGEQTYYIQREYSQEGKNRLLKETLEGGKTTTWEYLKDTHLVTKKIIKDKNQIFERELCFYDTYNNLIKTIKDDGRSQESHDLSGVTFRLITTYHLRQNPPFLHMVDVLEEKYFDGKKERLLKRTQLIYDKYGTIQKEHVYDSNNNLAYTLYKTHNERGDLLTETNPLGKRITYRYNAHGDPIFQNHFSNRASTSFTYDGQRRLIHKEQTGEGEVHLSSYEYDLQDRLIKKTNFLNHTKIFRYDSITQKVTELTLPSICSIDNKALPVETQTTYDPLGNPLSKKDANHNLTTYTYNSYGSPTQILHPDGTKEHFLYTKKGELASYTNPDGLTIKYRRDCLGKILSKTYHAPTGEEVAEETFTYKGPNLSSSTDKEGRLTQYSHDGAGRKIREETEKKVTHFSYDLLGYLEKVIQENGQNTLVTFYINDALGNILEKREETLSKELLKKVYYTYDPEGNQTAFCQRIGGDLSITAFEYDVFGRLTKKTDPLGHITKTTYSEEGTNTIGQRVLQVLQTDPLDRTHIKTFSPFNQVTQQKTLSPQGKLVAREENIYDPVGNLIYHIDHLYQDTTYLSSKTFHCTYTPTGNLKSLTHGWNTDDPRKTTYTYTFAGKLQTKTPPNRITLSYTYDPLGYPQTLISSNTDIFHTFEYSKVGHLLTATDENKHLTIQREIDPFGNILKETLPSGLTLEKEYDTQNRPLTLHIPKVGTIHSHYDPLFLKKVERFSSDGTLQYTHTYNTYDQNGSLLQENHIYDLGETTHTYDRKQREQHLHSPYFSEEVTYDPLDNLTRATLNTQDHTYHYDSLSQLTEEKGSEYISSTLYDSLYNPVAKNNRPIALSPHHALLRQDSHTYHYNLNGNTIYHTSVNDEEEFLYDPLNRLIAVLTNNAQTIYTYDPLGRRLSKIVQTNEHTSNKEEYYLYDRNNEIGAFTKNGQPINLKISGHKNKPVAIEIAGYPYAPILDIHGNIRKLIDPYRRIQASYHYNAFGQELLSSSASIDNPYRYQGKRVDSETGLIYFGKRYYNPELCRYLTTDPAGFANSTNLYQYVFNNPFRYTDPDGQFAFLLVLPLIPITAKIITGIVAITAGTYIAYEGAKALDTWINKTKTTDYTDDVPDSKEKKKKPPYSGEELGDDPTIPPAEGFEWKGSGDPASGKGSWVKGKGKEQESLYPDLKHPDPIAPHWDYISPEYPEGIRLYPDGSWEHK